jgi:hypothetical protein
MKVLVQMTLLHLTLSAILTLAVYYLQFVTYPKLKDVSKETFRDFHKRSSNKNFLFFIIFMFLETLSFYLMIRFDPDLNYFEWLPFAFMMIALWVITFFFMTSIDEKLNTGKHEKIIKELISWNWIRISLWTFKTLFLAFGVAKSLLK